MHDNGCQQLVMPACVFSLFLCRSQPAHCHNHPCSSHLDLLQLQQWVSPGPQCQVLQDTMWAIRGRTLELPQWWLHSMRGLWEGPLVSHWVVCNQGQPTGSECGLGMGHQSVVMHLRWTWQQWKVVRVLVFASRCDCIEELQLVFLLN